MTNYILRRLAVGCLTLLCVTFIVYALIRQMPGTPLTVLSESMDPGRMMDAADYKRMERAFGLDLPWYEAYFVWLGSMLQGDFGNSTRLNQPVLRVIGERVGPTLFLSVTSLLLTYVLSIPLGLYASARSGKWDERLVSTALYMLYSVPVFVAALFLQITFAVRLQWFALDLMHSPNFEQLGLWV
jgi:peptide/nickel transport system permease protein